MKKKELQKLVGMVQAKVDVELVAQEKTKGGHVKLVWSNGSKQRFTIVPSTGSDVRGMKNAVRDVVKEMAHG